MKVIFIEESDNTWQAASNIEKQSNDGCFSPNQIATFLNINPHLVQANVDKLEERGLCARINNRFDESRSGDERWCLVKPSLTVGREYEVLAIVGDDYILLNDPETKPYGNDPVAFHKSRFRISDPNKPSFWKYEKTADGEICYFPAGWDIDIFFEAYHDKVEHIQKKFWSDIKNYYPDTWKERKKRGHPVDLGD